MALAVLAALGGAGLWTFDQLSFITTTDARVRARMVTLSAEIPGRLVEAPLMAGDRVRRGAIVARLDDRQARAALAEASLKLKALEIEVEKTRLEAEITHDRGDQRMAGRRAGLDAAAADLSAAEAELRRAEQDQARTRTLHASGLVTDAALDRAVAALEVAQQAVLRAEARVVDARAGVGEAIADMRAAAIETRTADALALQAHALRQKIAHLKLDLDRHTITSPIDGVIDEVFAEAGEHVAPGVRLALAHASHDLWMEAHIKETDLPRIKAGADVEMRLDAAHASCRGTVERIGEAATSEFALIPNANPAGVFTKITQRVPVRIGIGPECVGVRPGAMATLRVRAG